MFPIKRCDWLRTVEADDRIEDGVGMLHRLNDVRRLTPIRVVGLTNQDEFPVSIGEFPVPAKQIPCSVQNRESSAGPWNYSANGRHNPAESAEMAGNFKNSLLFSLFSGNPGQ